MTSKHGVLCLTFLFLLVFGSLAVGYAAEEPIVMKLGHSTPVDYPYHPGALKFSELVWQKTNGRVKVDVYPGEQLGTERDLIESVKFGTVEMALVGIYDMYAPKSGVFLLPYIFRDEEHAAKVLDGPVGEEGFKEFLTKHGIRVLAVMENGFRQISTTKVPINSLNDLKGLKIRVPESPAWIDTMRALGAIPTPMTFGECIPALVQGLVDGQENALLHIYSFKTYQVQKYVAITNHIYGCAPLLINEKLFQSLSPDIRKAIQEAAREATVYERKVHRDASKNAEKLLKDAGLTITRPDLAPFREAAKKVWEKYRSQYGDLIDRIQAVK